MIDRGEEAAKELFKGVVNAIKNIYRIVRMFLDNVIFFDLYIDEPLKNKTDE